MASRGGGVSEGEADRLLGVDHVNRANSEGDSLLVEVGEVLLVEHVVQVGNLARGVGDDGELEVDVAELVDVLDPVAVALELVAREPDCLDPALGELGLELGHLAELGRADGREVGRVREQDRPRVADPVMELDRPLRRLGLEVGRDVAQAESCE